MEETAPIAVRYRLTLGELQAAYRAHQRRTLRQPALLLVAGILVVIAGFQSVRGNLVASLPLILFPGILCLVALVLPPWQIRRNYAKRGDRDQEIEWAFAGEQIRNKTARSTSEFAWSNLVTVVQTPDGFLLYPNPQIYYWAPRHGFENPADFERLAEMARARVPKFEVRK